MAYRGKIKDGLVVLDRAAALPDGTPVRVVPVKKQRRRKPHGVGALDDLWDGLIKMAGTVPGLPKDMARNHDHYIHGARRKHR